jgi:hypothetical protein
MRGIGLKPGAKIGFDIGSKDGDKSRITITDDDGAVEVFMPESEHTQMIDDILEAVAYNSFDMNGNQPVDRHDDAETVCHSIQEDIKKIAGIK